jgi:hypothetical protein
MPTLDRLPTLFFAEPPARLAANRPTASRYPLPAELVASEQEGE